MKRKLKFTDFKPDSHTLFDDKSDSMASPLKQDYSDEDAEIASKLECGDNFITGEIKNPSDRSHLFTPNLTTRKRL